MTLATILNSEFSAAVSLRISLYYGGFMVFPASEEKISGIVVPVASLRGKRDLGVGEFMDLIELGEWAAKIGFKLIQLLPVNDSGHQSSPYSALTAFALHPLYLSLAQLPEAKGFKADLEDLGRRFSCFERFPYKAILDAKLGLAKRMFQASIKQIRDSAQAGGALADWIDQVPWVIEYAIYRRHKDLHNGIHWRDWPESSKLKPQDILAVWNDPALKDDHLFWVWLQFRLDEQFKLVAASLKAMGIVLKGDLPILMNDDSCDVWAHPDFFRSDLTAGAPPDMFSPLGQNWQFPIYNWQVMASDSYGWWRQRLRTAERYYSAYRLDHVLGFFRIWALSNQDQSAVLGRFLPSEALTREELEQAGFSDDRLRWLSLPHLATDSLQKALSASADLSDNDIKEVFNQALERIGQEELWLFKPELRGERDIDCLPLHPAAKAFLQTAWRDRALLEFETGRYAPTWTYWDTRAFSSLSDYERRNLDTLIKAKRTASELIWEDQGRRLLQVLRESTPMQACAEDLGAVPDCVPRVLQELGIFSLRVIRWARRWGCPGEPYIALDDYPELSVCTPAVHDSSTLREWWEREADREVFSSFLKANGLTPTYTPAVAAVLLGAAASARSRLCLFQIQDLLHLSSTWYAADPASERINVPGTVNDFNWTYRLPAKISEIAADLELLEAAGRVASRI